MKITTYHIDVLEEMVNIGIGMAAGLLNEMVNARVHLQVPSVKVVALEEFKNELEIMGKRKFAAVFMAFNGIIIGNTVLAFPPDSASKLVAALTGEEPGTLELDSVTVDTLTEVGNIIINSVIGSISNMLKLRLQYSVPTYTEDLLDKLIAFQESDFQQTILMAEVDFTIKQLEVQGQLMLIFNMGMFEELLKTIDSMDKN
ncbi:hypothetical protein UZ36_03805 [Candidatus Nitromaritima sp. SCGC AAA799-C22]|nr:hypothetical protein UZ36_03805 [Candidatus Nitromaritima sp. SCGC AAA799-C22]